MAFTGAFWEREIATYGMRDCGRRDWKDIKKEEGRKDGVVGRPLAFRGTKKTADKNGELHPCHNNDAYRIEGIRSP